MKLVQGTCFNVSIFRKADCTQLLYIQIKAEDNNIWKFHMGKAFDKALLNDYKDIYKVMNAKSITISTEDTSRGSNIKYFQKKIKLI